ncbi:MAG: DNA polymerase III subunit delta [Acidobacteriota bacterium]|jgi:DNA polymerase III delta subunit|nr:DNA polymerase III subunit delta [Acidobacteriota bacterium]
MPVEGFFSFLQRIEQRQSPPPFTILAGFHEFLGEWVIQAYVRAFLEDPTDFNFRRYYLEGDEDAGWSDVVEEAQTASFFIQSRKVIVAMVRDPRRISLSKPDQELLVQYLKKPSAHSLIILYVSLALTPDDYRQLQKGKLATLIKQLHSPSTQVVDLDRIRESDVSAFIRNRLKERNVRITDGALDRLQEMLGERYVSVLQWVSRFEAWAREDGVIDIQDVDQMVTGVDPHSIWDLTDAVEQEDAVAYLRVLRYLFANGVKPAMVIGTLVTYYNKIFTARFLLRQHRSSAEIGRILQQPSFFLDRFIRTVRRFSDERLGRILDLIYRMDFESKTGGEDAARLLLQQFIFQLRMRPHHD